MSIGRIIEMIFLSYFGSIYSTLRTQFMTYASIAVLNAGVIWIFWHFIMRLHKKRKKWLAFFAKVLLVCCEVFLIAFLIWFIFIYFHTFTMMDAH